MKLIKMLTGALVVPFLVSCGGSKTATETTPEEMGLNLVKITEESNNSVLPSEVKTSKDKSKQYSAVGFCRKAKISWAAYADLAISPDG